MKMKIGHISVQNLKLYVLDHYIRENMEQAHICSRCDILGMEAFLGAVGFGKD